MSLFISGLKFSLDDPSQKRWWARLKQKFLKGFPAPILNDKIRAPLSTLRFKSTCAVFDAGFNRGGSGLEVLGGLR